MFHIPIGTALSIVYKTGRWIANKIQSHRMETKLDEFHRQIAAHRNVWFPETRSDQKLCEKMVEKGYLDHDPVMGGFMVAGMVRSGRRGFHGAFHCGFGAYGGYGSSY